jgi:hypothetical protein
MRSERGRRFGHKKHKKITKINPGGNGESREGWKEAKEIGPLGFNLLPASRPSRDNRIVFG